MGFWKWGSRRRNESSAENIDGKYELLLRNDGTFPNHHPDPSEPKSRFCK